MTAATKLNLATGAATPVVTGQRAPDARMRNRGRPRPPARFSSRDGKFYASRIDSAVAPPVRLGSAHDRLAEWCGDPLLALPRGRTRCLRLRSPKPAEPQLGLNSVQAPNPCTWNRLVAVRVVAHVRTSRVLTPGGKVDRSAYPVCKPHTCGESINIPWLDVGCL